MGALTGRTAVIIGGAGGAGSGFARMFAKEGAKVLVNDAGFLQLPDTGDYDITAPTKAEADRVTSEIKAFGGIAEADYEDASTSAAAKRIVEHAMDVFGSVDIVVHAANVSHLGMIEELTDDEWSIVMRQNVDPLFYLTRETLPFMKKQGFGRHIYLGSATVRDMWGGANYGAASGAMYTFMRCVAVECKDSGVTANSIEPWTVTKTGGRPSGQKMLRDRAKALGLPDRVGEPLPAGDTNAPLGAYLCTEAGGVFNGQYFTNKNGRICLLSTMLEQRYLYKNTEANGEWTVDELTKLMPATLLLSAQPLWHDRI